MKNFASPVMCSVGLAVAIVCMGAVVNAISCTTDENSPLQAEGNGAVDYILEQGVKGLECGQVDCNDSQCSQLYPVTNPEPAGAKVQICGDCDKYTTCITAGNTLNDILAQCVLTFPDNTARSAGYETVDDLKIVLDKMP